MSQSAKSNMRLLAGNANPELAQEIAEHLGILPASQLMRI